MRLEPEERDIGVQEDVIICISVYGEGRKRREETAGGLKGGRRGSCYVVRKG